MVRRYLRPAVAGALLLCTAAAPQLAHSLTALRMVERGQWRLKERAGGERRLCLGDAAALLQLGHPGVQCEQFVMADSPRGATVRYTCPGHGHGRTTVTVETGRLLRVETQGVADGAPFELEYEARKVGACN